MIKTGLKALWLTACTLPVASLAAAHPGHDHTHADHTIVEMPARDVSPFIGLGVLFVIVAAALVLRRRRDQKR